MGAFAIVSSSMLCAEMWGMIDNLVWVRRGIEGRLGELDLQR